MARPNYILQKGIAAKLQIPFNRWIDGATFRQVLVGGSFEMSPVAIPAVPSSVEKPVKVMFPMLCKGKVVSVPTILFLEIMFRPLVNRW